MICNISSILNIKYYINDNKCWIPNFKSRDKDGYVRIRLGKNIVYLHRASISAFNKIDYSDYTWESRHHKGCDKACFNPEHLSYGSHKDNMQDKISHGMNHNLNKDKCSKCGGCYINIIRKTGIRKGMKFRRCQTCANRKRRKELKHD